MPITIVCPHCQCKMTVPDALAGKRGKCSKCKGVVTVPAASLNGAAASAPPAASKPPAAASDGASSSPAASPPVAARTPNPPPAAKKAAPSAPPGPAKGPARTAPAPRPTPDASAPKASAPPRKAENGVASASAPPPAAEDGDLEAAALAALADEPAAIEAKKDLSVLEFECPMCNEPLKMPLELGGKKAPCPECKRIITVPVPRPEQRSSWRDTGPNLPSAARRPDEPAPADAWGSKNVTSASREGLLETGVIQEREKPRTLFQKLFFPVLAISLGLGLLVGYFSITNRMESIKENQALDAALLLDEKTSAAVGPDGLAALHGYAALHHLRTNTSGCAGRARDELLRAIALTGATRNPECDALLIDLVPVAVGLGGNPQELAAGVRLKWDIAHKTLRELLAAITAPDARLEGLRRAAASLVEHGQPQRVMPLAAQVSAGSLPAYRSEALAVAGLELLRLGKKDEAIKLAEQAEAPFAQAKGPPPLSPSVVALNVALERKELKATTKQEDVDAMIIGPADGLTRLGKMKEARDVARRANGVTAFRAWGALATAAADMKQADQADFTTALSNAGRGPSQPWLALRLIDAGVRAGVPAESLEPAVAAAGPLAPWARLLLLRSRLASSSSSQSVDVLESFPANSLAGRVARLDLSRHNFRASSKWADTVKGWDDGARPFGSLGLALGMQKGK